MSNKAKLMCMTPLDMVREFSEVMGLPLDQPSQFDKGYDTDLEGLRYSLVLEEFNEFTDAHSKENLLKELADLVYVVYNYAATYGLNLDEAVRRVHESNMSKLDDNGEPVRRADGKVLKGPNYKEADLGDLV
tara:strand:+ start:92 stop:487 length:396 start_codon:yes stop_codon:yes gene_type:complete